VASSAFLASTITCFSLAVSMGLPLLFDGGVDCGSGGLSSAYFILWVFSETSEIRKHWPVEINIASLFIQPIQPLLICNFHFFPLKKA
jgi:hypothetical protein